MHTLFGRSYLLNSMDISDMSLVSYLKLFEELKRYVRFGERDVALLAQLKPHAEPHFEVMVRAFYERAREHHDAYAVFVNDAQIERLHRSLIGWLERMLSGPYDAEYCATSARIGQVHVHVGLPQRYMFAAMSLFRMELSRIVDEVPPTDAADTRDALSRILDIELALMSETYRDAHLARGERLRGMSDPSQLRYKAAVELAGAMIVALDMNGSVQLFNREAERITGYAFDEVQGSHFADTLVVDPQGCGFVTAWQQAIEAADDETASMVPVGCVLRTRSGRQREIRGTMSRAKLDGEGCMVFLVGRDVTEENLLAARLRRTEKLASIGTLAAGLAHEIRNPLNGARLHLTLLRRHLGGAGGDPEAIETIDVVDGEIQRLSSLVADFLNFARPRELQRSATSLKHLCSHCGEMVKGRAAEAHVALEIQLPMTALCAHIDGAKIEQVLLNLLDNAIAAAPAKGGKVVLRAYREPNIAVIEVIDNGDGLEEPGAAIFDAFYSTKPNGTGLGLAIAHRIVTDHGGTLTMTSKRGDTRFVTLLPLDEPKPSTTRSLKDRNHHEGKS